MTEPKYHALVFTGDMVIKTLAGEKDQTRRVIDIDPKVFELSAHYIGMGIADFIDKKNDEYVEKKIARPGDVLWAKETFSATFMVSGAERSWLATPKELRTQERLMEIKYRADFPDSKPGIWVSPYFMSRWMSRIGRPILKVEVEQIQDITEEDSLREGVEFVIQGEEIEFANIPKGTKVFRTYGGKINSLKHERPYGLMNAKDSFRTLWDSLNEKRKGGRFSWIANPFVKAYTFGKGTK